MYRISHGSINTATRRDSTPDLSKKATSNNMNGTINATTRRDFEVKPNVQDTKPAQTSVPKPLTFTLQTPTQTTQKPISAQNPTLVQNPVQKPFTFTLQTPATTQNPVSVQTPTPAPVTTQNHVSVQTPAPPKPLPVQTPTPKPVPIHPTTSTLVLQPAIQEQTKNLQQLSEIKDQYVKIAMSLNQVNAGSGAVRKELESYKKLTDERIDRMANLFLSIYNQTENSDIDLNNIKAELSSYKKITDERIEKIANLFLSINK